MSPDKSRFEDLSVLYLEDEVLISIDVTNFLRDTGFGTVTTVCKLRQATSAAEDQEYDLALLDINVDRGQTSHELGARLKRLGTGVIFASGNGNDSERLRNEGFHFIDKPFSHQALETMISSALEGRTAKRAVS